MNALSQRLIRDARALAEDHREKLPYLAVGAAMLLIYVISFSRDSSVQVYKTVGTPDFKDARVLGSQGDSLYEGKERLLNKTMRELMAAQATLRESNEKLQAKVAELEKGRSPEAASTIGPNPLPSPGAASASEAASKSGLLGKDAVRVGVAPESLSISTAEDAARDTIGSGSVRRSRGRSGGYSGGGTSIISFPVKDIPIEKSEGVVLPAGSYVKAKLMTGVEAPEGKTFPVLLQLDYAYIVPNKHKLDLSGCFMIAKSQGDLSTERVQMQASKLSCVSKEGKMFERDVNGFIADDKDNSFAVMGSVNSKQDRVAAMAFMASVVKGVGSALQQAQSSTQSNSGFGTQSNTTNVTGSQLGYIAGGGASEAASQVTQWYLRQAQNLLPTINVGSGQDVWVVMQDTVKLPNDYFRKNVKGGASESVYTYFSRIVD